MILNVTNCKTISKLLKTPYIERWAGHRIQIYVDPKVKFKGEETLCHIGDNNSVRENVTISRGTASRGYTRVGSNNLLMENMHIAHDCIVGSGCIIGNSTKFGGEVVIDDFAIISATVLAHQFCRIGSYVMIQGGSRFSSGNLHGA